MCSIDGDYSEFWTESKVTARKTHDCDCCSGLIRPRDEYWKHFSVHDGSPYSAKMCACCRGARQEFGEEHRFFPTPGALPEMLAACFREEHREHWTPQDKRWRQLLAGIKRRGRKVTVQEVPR